MLDPELQRAADAILAVLQTAMAEDHAQLSPRVLIERTLAQGIGEEAVRVALWELVDQRKIEFTMERQIRVAQQTALAS